MLIPVRCFTCGKTISDKWVPFIKGVNEKKDKDITNDVKDGETLFVDVVDNKININVE